MVAIDVLTASRAELEAAYVELIEVVVKLEKRIGELEAQLRTGAPKGMPGLKPGGQERPKERRKRKARQQAFVRRRTEPSEQVVHRPEQCPGCGTALAVGGSVHRTREVIELPTTPVRVIEHAFIELRCPNCGKRVVAKGGLEGVVMGKQRFGIGLVSLVATLREEERLPLETIQKLLERLYQLKVSTGALTAMLQGVAKRAQPAVEAIQERVRASAVVFADETGWRQDGKNGYVWTFSTPNERYFVHGRRDKTMVDKALGEEFSGVLVCDFYAAYHHYAGLKQRCWAHLLREVHEIRLTWPEDKQLRQWAKAIQSLFERAKRFTALNERIRLRAQQRFKEQLLTLCQPYTENEAAPQRKLAARMRRHVSELFTFVAMPEVPADNNAAERSLRHLVIARKISGGTRSAEGTATKMALATLFGTWRTRGIEPLAACRQLLTSPHP